MKYARKLSFCYYVNIEYTTGGTEQIRACASRYDQFIRLNCQLITRLEMMDILQAQVSMCISAHRRLPDQKMKRETSDA